MNFGMKFHYKMIICYKVIYEMYFSDRRKCSILNAKFPLSVNKTNNCWCAYVYKIFAECDNQIVISVNLNSKISRYIDLCKLYNHQYLLCKV